MKYCFKCGAVNDDQSRYCYMCGAPLTQEKKKTVVPAEKPSASSQPSLSEPVRDQGIHSPASEAGSAATKLRELITSRTYEVAIGALAAQVVFSLIGSFTSYSRLSAWESLLYNTGIGYYMNMSGGGSLETLFSAIVNNGITILILIGLWLQYSYAKDKTRSTQTTGFRILRVMVTIQLVLIGAGFILIFVSMFTIGTSIGSNMGSYGTMITGVFLLLIFVLVICALYFYRIRKMLESAISVMEKGTKSCPAYGFVTVMIYIVAAATAISGVTALTQGSLIPALDAVSGSVALFAFGSLAGKFNQLEVAIPARPYSPSVNAAPVPKAESVKEEKHVGEAEPVSKAKPVSKAEPVHMAEHPRPVQPYPAQEDRSSGNPSAEQMRSAYEKAEIPGEEGGADRDYAMGEETMLLDGNQMIPPARLVRLRDQNAVRITKKQFSIGKAAEGVDYRVDGNPAVSRRHAEIDYRDGNFYIVDTNSTNHVYVDDRMIPPGMPVRITNGTRIRLGNEMFQFSEG